MFSATWHPKKKKEGGEKLLDGCITWPHLPQMQERIGAHCTCDPAVPFCWSVWVWPKQWPEVGDMLQPAGIFLLLHSWQLGSSLIWGSLKVVSCSWRDGGFLSVSKANYLKWSRALTYSGGEGGPTVDFKVSCLKLGKIFFLSEIIKEKVEKASP